MLTSSKLVRTSSNQAFVAADSVLRLASATASSGLLRALFAMANAFSASGPKLSAEAWGKKAPLVPSMNWVTTLFAMAMMARQGTMPKTMRPMPTATWPEDMQNAPAATRHAVKPARLATLDQLAFSTGVFPAFFMRSS